MLQQLVSLQNPCSFTVDGLLLAGVTTDMLRHLSSVELAKTEPGVPADRLGALASHVIGQRRYGTKLHMSTCLDMLSEVCGDICCLVIVAQWIGPGCC